MSDPKGQRWSAYQNPVKRSGLNDFVNRYFGGKNGYTAPLLQRNRHKEKKASASRVSHTKSYPSATRNGCSGNGRAFHRALDMLTPSLPLSRSLDLPVCLARFPSARLWLKDEILEDSAHTDAERIPVR